MTKAAQYLQELGRRLTLSWLLHHAQADELPEGIAPRFGVLERRRRTADDLEEHLGREISARR